MVCQDADGSNTDFFLGLDTGSGAVNRYGVKLTTGNSFIGETDIETISFNLKKRGTITGTTVHAVIWANQTDFANNTQVASSSNQEEVTTTDYGYVSFDFATPFTLTENAVYGIEQNSGTAYNDSNGVESQASSSTTVTGNVSVYHYGTNTVLTDDTMTLCETAITPVSSGVSLPPPIAWVNI